MAVLEANVLPKEEVFQPLGLVRGQEHLAGAKSPVEEKNPDVDGNRFLGEDKSVLASFIF